MFKKRLKPHAILWVLKRTRRRWPAIILLALLSAANAWFGVQFALSTRSVIDAAQFGNMQDLTGACIGLALLIVATIATQLFSTHLGDKLDVDLDRDMKRTMMHEILQGDYQVTQSYHSGDLVHRLNADVATVNGAVMGIATSLCSLITQTTAAVVVMISVSLSFTLVMLGVAAVIGGGTLLLQRVLKDMHKQINDASGRISGFLQEVIERLLIVQALDVGPAMEAKTDELLEERWKLQRKRKNLGLMSNAGLNILGQAIGFVTLIWCANEMFNGRMSFGVLTATTQLASRLETPVYYIPFLLRQLIALSASAERLMEIENIPREERHNDVDPEKLYRETEVIGARDLCFEYGRNPVLKGLNFEIRKGSMTVIIGQSGSGKSTLLRLLLSMYKPGSGELFALKKDGTRVQLSGDTRRMFTYAPQGNLLLSGSLRDNIVFAKPDATEEEIAQAVYISAIEDYLPQLPEGLDTRLGENATGLSEGQAQRVALARAVLSGAPILLLDEVTSALDMETERKVLERIKELKDRTCIVVTHRPAVLEMADTVMSIVDGRMV